MRRKSWDKGQSTLEYFIIFAVIACVVIPLWSGSLFLGVKDAGKGFLDACMNRLITEPTVVDPGGSEFSLVYEFVFPNPISDISDPDYTASIYANIPRGGGEVKLVIKDYAEGEALLTITWEFSIGSNNERITGDASSLSSGGPYPCDLYFNDVRKYKNFDKVGVLK